MKIKNPEITRSLNKENLGGKRKKELPKQIKTSPKPLH